MKRKSPLILLLIFAFAGFIYYSRNENLQTSKSDFPSTKERIAASVKTNIDKNQIELQEMTSDEVEQMDSQEKSEKNKVVTITPDEVNTLNENFPDKQKVDEELQQNPHTPSKSLMSFAKILGPLMEKAFNNESDANILVDELSECANGESVAIAARAMCVTNTERLAKIYPKIEKVASDLRTGVSPEVQKILDTNDAFIKR